MKGKRYGFTVLECLIVISILAGQLAILMPMLESKRESDKNNTCQSNLKECVIALQLYWNDYDSTLPSSVLASNEPDRLPPTQAQVVDFLTSTDGKWSGRISPSRPRTWPNVLKSHMKYFDCIFCPSDTPGQQTSYWWKYAVDLAWRSKMIKKESSYAYHSDQIILYEHAGWHTGNAAGIKDGVIINVAFMDAHVNTVTIQNGPVSYPTASDECSGLSAVRLGEPMYFNFDADNNSRCSGPAANIDPQHYYDKF